ncbi:class II aldolase/adducin family protein [Rhodopila sp.]|uniref:class II aldolase/adducin family protein n=1 Tax=Rhodopila sp. TaxID=2480087 RepID=UPI003D0CEC0E
MIRDQVVWLYRTLGERGLIVGSAGNVSARTVEDPKEGMLITPSGGDPERVSAADLAHVTLDNEALDDMTPSSATPSSEWALHAAVYRTCPGAAFIAHTHADACTALACLNQPLPAFHYMVLQFGGDDVRCAPYVTFGTPALAELAAVAIEGRTACLLANHGMIVSARSTAEALTHSILLETLSRQYLLARSAGTPRLLTRQEMQDARERFKTYGPRPPI